VRKKRVLCVCMGGDVRSGTLARILKHEFNMDALAVGVGYATAETFHMLAEWADHIVIPADKPVWDSDMIRPWERKVIWWDIGPDVWHQPLHPELLGILSELAHKWLGIKRPWPEREKKP